MRIQFQFLGLAGLLFQIQPVVSSTTSQFGTLTETQTNGVLDIVILNNSTKLNLWDNKIESDLYDLVTRLQHDETVKAVVFKSGNPEFFFGLLDFAVRSGKDTHILCTIFLVSLLVTVII